MTTVVFCVVIYQNMKCYAIHNVTLNQSSPAKIFRQHFELNDFNLLQSFRNTIFVDLQNAVLGIKGRKYGWNIGLQVYSVHWSQTRDQNLVVSGSWDTTAKLVSV